MKYPFNGRAVLLVSCLFLFTLSAFAEDPKKELPKQGALSSSGMLGTGKSSVGLPWGGDENGITGGSPVTGSVSRVNDSSWQMRLFNNSKDSAYSVNVQVIQYGKDNSRLKTDTYSYTIKAGKSAERTVNAAYGAAYADLNLDRWKKIGGSAEKKKASEDEAKPSTEESEQTEPTDEG